MQGHILGRTFCKRSEQQVRKLVAGPGVYICDRCTELAHAIITELAHAIIHEGGPPASVGPLWQRVGRRVLRLFGDRAGTLQRPTSEHAV